METKKEKVTGLTPVVIDDATTTRGKVKKGGDPASWEKIEIPSSVKDSAYNALSVVELETAKTSVSLAVLDKVENFDGLRAIVNSIKKEIEIVEASNCEALANAFRAWFEGYTFSTVTEKRLFLRALCRARMNTKKFAITFQTEETEETIGHVDGVPYRATRWTAAGVRAAFNSSAILAPRVRAAAKAARVEAAKDFLLNFGTPSAVLDVMQDSQILSLYEKINGLK